eukprot:UN04714
MSPESIQKKTYSKKSDSYMFGITMWEIFYGIEPYSNENMNTTNIVIDVVRSNKRPQIIDNNNNMPNQYKELMEWCWSQDPQKRPTFNQIVHLLTQIDSNPLSKEYWD